MNKNSLFYLQDSRSLTGNNATFWGKSGGYTTNISDATVYSLDEAQKMHDSRHSDIPLLKSAVDKLSIQAIDHQYLPDSNIIVDGCDAYVVQVNGSWNGNDILFIGSDDESCHTYDYEHAAVFSAEQVMKYRENDAYSVFSKASLDKIVRRTLQSPNISRRVMAFNAGINLVPLKRNRPTSGKTRGNCPCCGKFTWDYDPHVNHYCFGCK